MAKLTYSSIRFSLALGEGGPPSVSLHGGDPSSVYSSRRPRLWVLMLDQVARLCSYRNPSAFSRPLLGPFGPSLLPLLTSDEHRAHRMRRRALGATRRIPAGRVHE